MLQQEILFFPGLIQKDFCRTKAMPWLPISWLHSSKGHQKIIWDNQFLVFEDEWFQNACATSVPVKSRKAIPQMSVPEKG